MYVLKTIRMVSVLVNSGRDFDHSLCEFLDDFYSSTPDVRMTLIAEAPLEMSDPVHLPFLAATAHKLANDFDITPPAWVFEDSSYLSGKRPYVTNNAKGGLKLLYYYCSPPEFKHRNIFTSPNVLSRA
jgi:hypothetical protein